MGLSAISPMWGKADFFSGRVSYKIFVVSAKYPHAVTYHSPSFIIQIENASVLLCLRLLESKRKISPRHDISLTWLHNVNRKCERFTLLKIARNSECKHFTLFWEAGL